MRALLVLAEPGRSAKRVPAALETAGISIARPSSLAFAEHKATSEAVDAIVFDPEVVDHDFAARVRARRPALALIASLDNSSSARTAELLAAGLDEVLHAGMGDAEIAARAVAAIRRSSPDLGSAVEVGLLRIDAKTGEAVWGEDELPLSGRERALLHALATASGTTVRREVLYRRVWGYAMARGDRTVDVNVKRLRAKLDSVAGDAIAIRTQAGVGYRLEVADVPAVTTL